MKQFIELLNEQQKLTSNEQHEWVSAQIEKLLSEGHLNAWHLGEPTQAEGQRILIGIVRWSAYDLRLLDSLNHAFSSKFRENERIDILDIDAAGRSSGNWDFFEQVIPGIGKIYQTPIVGIWENGMLLQRGAGAAGRDLVINRYGLNRDEILAQPHSPV
jgi:hypothetical protein